MTWREAVESAVRRFAAKSDGGAFTRQEFLAEEEQRIVSEVGSRGQTPGQTISRVLQELRDDGIIAFLEGPGSYRLNSDR